MTGFCIRKEVKKEENLIESNEGRGNLCLDDVDSILVNVYVIWKVM